MPAPTDQWDETKPADSRQAKLGDDDIREFKRQIRERMNWAGQVWEDGSSGAAAIDTDAAKLKCGVQGTTGTLVAALEEDGDDMLVFRDDTAAANASEVDIGDGTAGARPYTLNVDEINANTVTGDRIHNVAIPLVGVAGRVNGVYYYNNTGFTITLLEVDAYANTAPSGTNLDLDIHTHATSWTDLSSGGTSVVASPPTISVVAGSRRAAAPVTTFSDATLAAGEVWAFDIDTLSSAADIILFLKIKKTN